MPLNKSWRRPRHPPLTAASEGGERQKPCGGWGAAQLKGAVTALWNGREMPLVVKLAVQGDAMWSSRF